MNIIFHTIAAIGVSVAITDTNKINIKSSYKKIILTSVFAFIVGIISHGVLDYIPHCYPINSKFDAIASFVLIITFIVLTNKPYKLITALSFAGCIFPDLVDLLPAILNKYLNLHLKITTKIFPWHWPEYSGSLYNSDCNISILNQVLLIFAIITICWFRRTDLKQMMMKNYK